MSKKISGRQAVKFLIENNVTSNCQYCNHDEAMVPTIDSEDINSEKSIVRTIKSNVDGTHHLEFMPVICNNCGFTRNFLAGKVVEFSERSQNNE